MENEIEIKVNIKKIKKVRKQLFSLRKSLLQVAFTAEIAKNALINFQKVAGNYNKKNSEVTH